MTAAQLPTMLISCISARSRPGLLRARAYPKTTEPVPTNTNTDMKKNSASKAFESPAHVTKLHDRLLALTPLEMPPERPWGCHEKGTVNAGHAFQATKTHPHPSYLLTTQSGGIGPSNITIRWLELGLKGTHLCWAPHTAAYPGPGGGCGTRTPSCETCWACRCDRAGYGAYCRLGEATGSGMWKSSLQYTSPSLSTEPPKSAAIPDLRYE